MQRKPPGHKDGQSHFGLPKDDKDELPSLSRTLRRYLRRFQRRLPVPAAATLLALLVLGVLGLLFSPRGASQDEHAFEEARLEARHFLQQRPKEGSLRGASGSPTDQVAQAKEMQKMVEQAMMRPLVGGSLPNSGAVNVGIVGRRAEHTASEPSPFQAAAPPATAAPNPTGTHHDPLRGVTLDFKERYTAAVSRGAFACFDSSRILALTAINDNYCDCADGSDEPGTSACAGMVAKPILQGFYCKWHDSSTQVASKKSIVLLSRVNDGVCDCCGGEDEWDNDVVCKDRCGDLAAKDNALASRAAEGNKARRAYIERGKQLASTSPYSGYPGGPENAFLAVAENGCQENDDGSYTFKVCVFDRVEQVQHGGRHFTLGKGGAWHQTMWENGEMRTDYSHLVMGDGEFCYASQAPRRTEIHFECGPKDKLLSIREAEVCVYKVHFETPAVCGVTHGDQGDSDDDEDE
eukprot:gnl/MRDRNA2_/MRDRNA2_33954_c0_seq1.p1 gnl/MRDRNA2_/MRDRNA2_33954_c0~~gnl/MRDRNA2_/MRDRNA2_33954_c0_seq1.p1  ORF type:complete len:464 (+),score=85.61 gnl/MRDRNA2_/MRDRNA2_33954_c0_seq1:32-1423(+)